MSNYINVLKRFWTFTGRARRFEFWMFALVNAIALLVLVVIEKMLVIIGLSTLFLLVVLLPSVAVGIRRLHDTGRSGWWLLVPLVPILFLAQGSQPGSNAYGASPKGVAA